jgi:hypothetical protein
MNAKQFAIVSVSVAVPLKDANATAEALSDVSGNFGFYSMGTGQRTPSRAEWKEIRANVPEDILTVDASDAAEQQRRDEKHGLHGGKEDVAN